VFEKAQGRNPHNLAGNIHKRANSGTHPGYGIEKTVDLSNASLTRRPFWKALLGILRVYPYGLQFGQQFELNFLDFYKPLPLVRQKVVEFLVYLSNLELRLQIDLVVMGRPSSILCFLPVLAHHDDRGLYRS